MTSAYEDLLSVYVNEIDFTYKWCIAVHPIYNNIHDTKPLDNLSYIVQIDQHCLT